MFRTTDLRGVRVATADLEAAIKAFRDAFGFPLSRSRFLSIGKAEIEMAMPAGEEDPLARFLAERGPGLESLLLEVDDLEQAATALAERGIPVERSADAAGQPLLRLSPQHTHGVPLALVARARR